MSLGKRIARARRAKGMTQAELARAIKKSRSSVNEYETDEHEPRMVVLKRIARICDVPLVELLA